MSLVDQIRILRNEAANAGDIDMFELCELALSGNPDDDHRVHVAFERCLQAIREATSLADEDDNEFEGEDPDAVARFASFQLSS